MTAKTPSTHVETLQNRVREFILLNRLCGPDDRVLVACSGGTDSTALLDILRKLAPELNVSLGVIYIDHGQQPASRQAQDTVRRRCHRWKLAFFASRIAADRLPPGSGEARMREERLRVLVRLADAQGYTRVATGHTESDQVETVLMRILRGTSPAGLAAIPARRDRFIRPLLCCTREELSAYLKVRRLAAVEDPTNRDRRHLRNRIRHDILPLIRRTVNPAVDSAILRLSRSASRDNQLLTRMARGGLPGEPSGECLELPVDRLDNLHDAVLSRVVVQMARVLLGPGANLEQRQVDRILTAIRSKEHQSRFALDLPGGLRATLDAGFFRLRLGDPDPPAGFHLTVQQPGEIGLPCDGGRLRFSLASGFDADLASRRHVFFDAKQVRFPLVVRSVAPGDRLHPWGAKGSRKVARLLMDAKIQRKDRIRVPLLVCRDRLLWVAGLRRSRWAPVRKGTDQVLSVEWLEPAESDW